MRIPRSQTLTAVAVAAALVGMCGQYTATAAESIDYVGVCNAFGTGHLQIPGTKTCFRARHRVRTDYNLFFNLNNKNFNIEPSRGIGSNLNFYRFRARGYVYLDALTPSEFGLLRVHSELRFTKDTSSEIAFDAKNAFIVIGGLRLGTSTSIYDFLDAGFTPAQFFDPSFSDDVTTNLITYNWRLAHGFDASISIEDNTARRDGLAAFNVTRAGVTLEPDADYGGAIFPDVIGRVRYSSGAWSSQLMGALHFVNALTTVERSVGAPAIYSADALGFAAGAGIKVEIPFGRASEIGATSTYSHGALSYASSDVNAPNGLATDGIVSPSGYMRLSDFFSVSGGGKTSLAPNVEIGLQVGYLFADVDNDFYDLNDNGQLDDFDYFNLDLQTFLSWTPKPGLLLGVGAEYRYVGSAGYGQSSFLTTYVRAQRSF